MTAVQKQAVKDKKQAAKDKKQAKALRTQQRKEKKKAIFTHQFELEIPEHVRRFLRVSEEFCKCVDIQTRHIKTYIKQHTGETTT